MPISEELKGQGLYFPKIPEVTMQDMNLIGKETTRAGQAEMKRADEFFEDPNIYIKKAALKYRGQQFIISEGVGDQVKVVKID